MQALEGEFSIFEGEGTLFGSLGRSEFERIRWLAPAPEVVAAFERTVASLDQLIASNEHQCELLTDLRDMLLPKLLSGEVRVRDAEDAAAEALV